MLATGNTVDFLYTCDSHLVDPGFASKVVENVDVGGTKTSGLSPEEIAKVKAEWEERQARKKEKAKEQKKAKESDKDKDGEDKEGKSNKDHKGSSTPAKASSPPAPVTSTTPQPAHQRYILHRDIFSMRQAEHRKRRQQAQANQLAPLLPQAPRSPLPNP